MAHTPGPWIIVEDGYFSEATPLTILAHDATVAGIAGHSDPLDEWFGATDETWANARLIAAAPDLLAALRALMQWADADNLHMDRMTAVEAAAAAIAKAEG